MCVCACLFEDLHLTLLSGFLVQFARRVRKVQLDPHQSTQNAALQKYKIKVRVIQ